MTLADRIVDDGDLMKELEERFTSMMSALFQETGASLRIKIVQNDAVEGFIDTHARVLDSSFNHVPMSEMMRERLMKSNYIFSGAKTFAELNKAFPLLVDEEGNRKPFEQFLNDVHEVDETYNKNYLRAEYNYAQAAAEMAGKWEKFSKDGDRYYLQYRTAGDDKVRPEHAALNGITLPVDDIFWDEYYPPNGWNCRCNVVQVLKSTSTPTPHGEAMKKGSAALEKDKKGVFRYNVGKDGYLFPKDHPYYTEAPKKVIHKLERRAEEKVYLTVQVNSIEEAQEFLSGFCEANAMDRTFKGKVNLSGISTENASHVCTAVARVFDTIHGLPKISGIRTVSASSATGKRVFKEENSIACYDPVSKGIWINKDLLKDARTWEEHQRQAREAFEIVRVGLDKLPPAKRAVAERYIKAGRELVDDSIIGCVIHELGHHFQWSKLPTELHNALGEGMSIRSVAISGYASASKSEYIAESFVSWVKGELRIDYRLQEYLDSICDTPPVNAGNWTNETTRNGGIRVSSLHGSNERAENVRVATYLANKYGFEIDLIPRIEQGKTPDTYNKTERCFQEYKVSTVASISSIDDLVRSASLQANSIVLAVDSGLSLGDLTNAITSRVRKSEHLQTLRIIRNDKDALYTRREMIQPGFKIEEADFK